MESSEDKTKRKFAAQLCKLIWTHQYSIFYREPGESHNLLDDQKTFRRELKRKFPDQPFLVRIQTLNRGVLQAYLTIFTTGKIDGLEAMVERYFPAPVNVINRPLTDAGRSIKAHKIRTQKAQDLTKLFGEVRIRRYGVTNKHLLADFEEAPE